MKRKNYLFYSNTETGGAALEYIVVSIFGLLLSLGAISFVGKAAQEKMKGLEEKLGIKLDIETFNPFGA